ncbi:MAG: isoprenylcysteine carboxylmethyltransferase family protein [Patescibacteria group bacterium]
MDNDFQNKTKDVNKEESILGLVVYSPIIYFLIFLVGFIAHFYYPIALPWGNYLFPIGVVLIFLAPLLIIWSQLSIKKFIENERAKKSEPLLNVGPYKYSRNPIYLSLALLTLGFSFISSSLLMLVSTIVSFLIVNIVILKREEKLMHKKYGDEYISYKSRVRPWI